MMSCLMSWLSLCLCGLGLMSCGLRNGDLLLWECCGFGIFVMLVRGLMMLIFRRSLRSFCSSVICSWLRLILLSLLIRLLCVLGG